MTEPVNMTREVLDGIEKYRQQMLSSADERIESLRYQLRREEELRAWCVKAIPFEIYSRQQESIAREVKERETADARDAQRKHRIQGETNNKFLIGALIIFSLVILVGLEWYASTSYGDFCYRIGHHIVSALIAVPVVGGVIWAGMWLTGELRSK